MCSFKKTEDKKNVLCPVNWLKLHFGESIEKEGIKITGGGGEGGC